MFIAFPFSITNSKISDITYKKIFVLSILNWGYDTTLYLQFIYIYFFS